MEELEKFKMVNESETLEQLSKTIIAIADEKGQIQGKEKKFNAEKMAHCCARYNNVLKNSLTRNYGIRQQALYITKYSQK